MKQLKFLMEFSKAGKMKRARTTCRNNILFSIQNTLGCLWYVTTLSMFLPLILVNYLRSVEYYTQSKDMLKPQPKETWMGKKASISNSTEEAVTGFRCACSLFFKPPTHSIQKERIWLNFISGGLIMISIMVFSLDFGI